MIGVGTLGAAIGFGAVVFADQAWMLKMMGCKVGQGYHFGRPKTAAEMREMLVEQGSTDQLSASA